MSKIVTITKEKFEEVMYGSVTVLYNGVEYQWSAREDSSGKYMHVTLTEYHPHNMTPEYDGHETRCKECGQVIDLGEFDQVLLRVSPLTRRILQGIRDNPGISGKELAILLYGESDDPIGKSRVISSTLVHWRKTLATLGWRVRSERGKRNGYFIEKVK